MRSISEAISMLPLEEGEFIGPYLRSDPLYNQFIRNLLWRKEHAVGVVDVSCDLRRTVKVHTGGQSDLHRLLSAAGLGTMLRPAEDFDDAAYFFPEPQTVSDVLATRCILPPDLTDWPDIFDCDDYAYALKTLFSVYRFRTAGMELPYRAMAAGLIWSKTHVANIVVTTAGIKVADLIPSTRFPVMDIESWKDHHTPQYIVI